MMWPIPLSQVHSLEGLASNLGTSIVDLEEFASAADQGTFYTTMRIPKRGKMRRGQFRTVFKPIQRLALLQKNLSSWLTTYTEFPEHVQGFVHRRSIASNARIHLGARRILHADLRDFFDAITTAQVEAAFRSLGCAPDIARQLARICTLNGRLPQGSSVSPCLANLVAAHLDADLKTLASATNCRYSRYADDITISGDVLPAEAEVARVIALHGFELRDGRCVVQRRGRAQYVTGLTIFGPDTPRVSRRAKRRLRLEMYYVSRLGLEAHLANTGSSLMPAEALARFWGWCNFIASIEGNGALFRQWVAMQKDILKTDD